VLSRSDLGKLLTYMCLCYQALPLLLFTSEVLILLNEPNFIMSYYVKTHSVQNINDFRKY